MASYYIATTGSDSNTGTQASPWLTLAHAYANSASGDTINVAAGAYTWVSATMASRTIQGAGATTTIFDAGGSSGAAKWSIANMTVNDLTFRNNGGYTGNSPAAFNGYGSTYTPITLNRCQFHDIALNSGYGLITGNSNTNPNTCYFGLTMTACLIYNISVSITGTPPLIHSGGQDGTGGGTGFLSLTACTVYVTDSHITTLYYTWAQSGGSNSGLTAKNSIIYCNNGGTMSLISGEVTTAVLSNTDHVNMTGPFTDNGGNINADPQFIDPTSANFNLRPTSPCIATGTLI